MNQKTHAVELLSPAGSLQHMDYAFAYGADAVYAGLPRYSLRVRNNGFKPETLKLGIDTAHAAGRKFYLTANLLPHELKVKTFVRDFEPIVAMQPDALIMADPGLIMLVRDTWPEMPIHLSVQANTINSAAVRFWERQGIVRIILSRELPLHEIAEIRQSCPDIELEVFVHGAICVAYSGRCLLSGYFNHRDANQGVCTNSCRWEYKLASPAPMQDNPALGCEPRHPAADEVYLLEEPNRVGEFMPIYEDENGTYIMNSKDLRAIEHVPKLVEIGIDCLKIEGRTKSHYYVARTAQVYRQALDDVLAGKPYRPELTLALEGLANRGYTEGFYSRQKTQDMQNYEFSASQPHRRLLVGDPLDVTSLPNQDEIKIPTGWTAFAVKNRFACGDWLEYMTPTGNHLFELKELQEVRGNTLTEAPGSGWKVALPLPVPAAEFGLLTRVLPDHEADIPEESTSVAVAFEAQPS